MHLPENRHLRQVPLREARTRRMNFKENETATKLRGGYYTKPEIAAFLLRWVLATQPKRLLEPSCGDGVFFRALRDVGPEHVESVLGFEIEPEEAAKSRREVEALGIEGMEVRERDFLSWALTELSGGETFDAVVGNPPFIRYQYLDSNLQELSERIFRHFDLRFTKHTNAWVPFVLASVALLRPGGRLAMVVPAEILHVLHAQSLRTFLTAECRQVLMFDPQELWFEDALQGAVMLLAERKESRKTASRGVGIIPTRSGAFLREDPERFFTEAQYANGATIEGKWMPALLSARERELLRDALKRSGVHRFAEVATANVGIVTGANKFFLVPDSTVQEFGLEEWAHPMFGRSEHVPGVIYGADTHEANRKAGLPANFLWFTDERKEELPQKVQAYLAAGEADKLHTRFKCRIREPWYSVPSVHTAPVGMLKRSHDFPRLILNTAEAFTTDTAYRIKPKNGLSPTALVLSFVNSLTVLSAELEGRHYGGGVLELVPSEIAKLILPVGPDDRMALHTLDKMVRDGVEPNTILRTQDAIVLSHVGLSTSETEELTAAWLRLRARRHREGGED